MNDETIWAELKVAVTDLSSIETEFTSIDGERDGCENILKESLKLPLVFSLSVELEGRPRGILFLVDVLACGEVNGRTSF